MLALVEAADVLEARRADAALGFVVGVVVYFGENFAADFLGLAVYQRQERGALHVVGQGDSG